MATKKKRKTTTTAVKKKTPAPKKKTPASKKKSALKKKEKKEKIQQINFVELEPGPPWTLEQLTEPAFEVVFEPKGAPLLAPTKVLEGHTRYVQALAFSPDGQLLATGSEDGTLRVWDLSQGADQATCLKIGTAPSMAINCVSFTPDGRHLLTASDGRTVRLWSVPAVDVIRTFEGHTDYVSKVYPAGGSTNRAVSSSKDGTLRLWDLETGACIHVMEHGGWVYALAASHNGRFAIAGSDRNVMRIWNLETGKVERVLVDASGDYIGEVMGLSLASENKTGVGHRNAPKHILFAPDDKSFVSSEKDLIVWETSSGRELARIDGDGWWIGGFQFIAGSRMPSLLLGAAATANTKVDPTEGAFLEALTTDKNDANIEAARSVYSDWLEEHGRVDEANAIRRHGSARHVLAAGYGAIHIFDLAKRVIVAEAAWSHGDARNIAVSPDARWGACGSDNGVVGLWDLDALFRAGLVDRHLYEPNKLVITQDGIALTTGRDNNVRLWSKDGESRDRLAITNGLSSVIDFTPKGEWALVMEEKGVLRAFDSKTFDSRGTVRLPDDPYRPFCRHIFLRDGVSMLVGSVSGPLAIWTVDPARGEITEQPELFEGEAGHVTAMVVDEDADLVVTAEMAVGEEPLRIKVWSLSKRKMIRRVALKPTHTENARGGTDIAFVEGNNNRKRTKRRLVLVTTQEGCLLILDLESLEVIHALKISADYYADDLVPLSDGKSVVVGGAGQLPFLIDVERGTIRAHMALGEDRRVRLIKGTTQAIVSSSEGVALVDYERSTLSAVTPLRNVGEVQASRDGGRFVITTSGDEDLAGLCVVLRRL